MSYKLDKCGDRVIKILSDRIKQLEKILDNADRYVLSVNYINPDSTGNVLVDKKSLGLENVDNTSDLNKPVSNATQQELNKKQNTLESGVNIKTINGQSLLGSGNITIEGGGSTIDLVGTFGDALQDYWSWLKE